MEQTDYYDEYLRLTRPEIDGDLARIAERERIKRQEREILTEYANRAARRIEAREQMIKAIADAEARYKRRVHRKATLHTDARAVAIGAALCLMVIGVSTFAGWFM